MTKSKSNSTAPRRGKSAAKRTAKPDHYTPEVVREFFARNPWMDCTDGVTFDESEKVNYDPVSGLVVKAGTPGSVPLGEIVLFVPSTDGRGAFAAIFGSTANCRHIASGRRGDPA